VLSEARIDPLIQTEYLHSGGAELELLIIIAQVIVSLYVNVFFSRIIRFSEKFRNRQNSRSDELIEI
jgi:hypothetical protein